MIDLSYMGELTPEQWSKATRTTSAFDTPWLKEKLLGWDIHEENKKAIFMEHMYNCSGRKDPAHPMHGLYTGLWKNFCLTEAGNFCRNHYFEMLAAVEEYERQKQELTISAVV